ncbi:MAG: PDZ domain-containing protein [Candidatus Fermentibacteria bacterium]
MKLSVIIVLLAALINTISAGYDAGPDITEFRELASGLTGVCDMFESVLTENDYISDTLLTGSILYPDSAQRHFYYVIPSSYDPEIKTPLFVWLHGGVSTVDLRTMEPETLMEYYLIPRLLEEGYLIAFPCGQADAVWWDTVGEEGILRIVRWMKVNFNADDGRVFVGGFSDGASGSFSLMMLHPSCFAGYLAFSGHIGVAAIDGERGTYLPSLSNRPGIASHSDEDGLYPVRKMAPTIALAESAGAVIEYHTFQGFEHDPSYLPQLEERIIEFLAATERERFPERITWEAGESSGCDWLMVDSIIPWPLLGSDIDYNAVLVSDRLRFGFYADWDYEGNGVLVAGVVDADVPASRLGLAENDIIIGFEGEDISSLDDIGTLQEEMLPGDSFSIAVLRNGETLELRDMFNPAEYYWLLPRSRPSVRVEAEYSHNRFDITVNRFCVIRLLLHPEMVDFSSDIAVTCNGYEIFRGQVEEDGSFAMDNLMNNLDIDRCYTAELELNLEELLLPLI